MRTYTSVEKPIKTQVKNKFCEVLTLRGVVVVPFYTYHTVKLCRPQEVCDAAAVAPAVFFTELGVILRLL